MNRLGRSKASHREAWECLRTTLHADIALVQEASPPEQFSHRAYHPIDERRYDWGSAAVALRPGLVVRERKRIPLANCYLDPVAECELPDSHPGACAVADVEAEHGEPLFAAISLYGQWEMMPGGKSMDACPRVHRMLSDLTGILAGSRTRPVILAGDLNVTTQFPSATPTTSDRYAASAAAAVFARLRAWDLASCLSLAPTGRTPLAHCSCQDGEACTHVRTFRTRNRHDSNPTQLDYAFASAAFAAAVTECRVEDTAIGWQFSDHCPVVVDIDEDRLGWARRGAS